MSKTYKVWIEVEELDEDTDESENIEQLDCGEMEYNAAMLLADMLHDIAMDS